MILRPSALLEPLLARGVNLSLDAMGEALRASGDPQRSIPAVHIAGTNGKGSVAAMVHNALRESGIRVARYTSPHLHRVAERFVIDGECVSDALLCEEILRVRSERSEGTLPPLSLFESLTLIAWRLFAQAKVELAVIEVGVGGRLDATNLCDPYVTAITRIARDHTQWLGETHALIAREKAGICKPSVPCVLGASLCDGEAREAIEAVAREVGAPLIDAPRAEPDHGDSRRWSYAETTIAARLSLDGAHQRDNAGVAVGVIDALRARGIVVAPELLARALATTAWPGRMERIGDVILDAAHNEDGLQALLSALREARVGAVVFGASSDKDLAAMGPLVAAMAPAGRRFATAATTARAASAAELATRIGGEAVPDPLVALSRARSRCAPGEAVVVCGSIFLIAELRAALLGIDAEPIMTL